MRSKLAFFGIFFAFAFTLFSVVPDTALGQAFNYTPLEKIPGASNASSFPEYVQGIYKFGIWTVGLAALFMLSVGGFVYLSSGGNTATLGKAKTYITDALIGLVLALLAYLILYVINPDLVNVNLGKFSEVGGAVIAQATPATPVVQRAFTPTANETLVNASNIADATYPDSWFPDAAQSNMIAALSPVGVIVRDSAGHTGTAALCKVEKQAASCTSLYQIRGDVESTLSGLAHQCRTFNNNQWCTISVTGGTEYWKHSKTTNHRPGNPVIDIGKNSSSTSFFNYLKSVARTPTCVRGGRNVYTIPINTNFGLKYVYLWDEDAIHWHVNLNEDMCH